MLKLYSDTNVLRYFGEAFRTDAVPAEIAVQLLLAPLALLELLSQLGTKDAESAFAAIQALPRIHNPEGCGILPWSDDFFRMCLFNLPPGEDVMIRSLNNALIRVLNAGSASELKVEGDEMRLMMEAGKQDALNNFTVLRDSMRAEGKLGAAEDRTIFAQSIARRANVAPQFANVDLVVNQLAAHYAFEQQRIDNAASNPDYNLDKRINDTYDSELLIYLADPSLHFLTCDKGFNRAKNSSQGDRIHVVKPDALHTAEGAIALLQSIVELPRIRT
jgi:hypothetical protein